MLYVILLLILWMVGNFYLFVSAISPEEKFKNIICLVAFILSLAIPTWLIKYKTHIAIKEYKSKNKSEIKSNTKVYDTISISDHTLIIKFK